MKASDWSMALHGERRTTRQKRWFFCELDEVLILE